MKVIIAAMAAVIVILVVALGAALMDKPDVVVREVPARVAPNPRPAFTGNENRQRQFRDIEYRVLPPVPVDIETTKEALEEEIREKLRYEAWLDCHFPMVWDIVNDKCVEFNRKP